MDKRSKIIIAIFITVLLGIVITEIVRPTPLNWKQSYTATDKIPFGCYVLHNELPSLFPNEKIIDIKESFYTVFNAQDSLETSNYLMINNGINFDEQEYKQLLSYVSRGNDVFIASSYFGNNLSDTLNLEVDYHYAIREDSVQLSLSNTNFKSNKFQYTKGMYNRHFRSIDSLNTTILGNITYTDNDYIETNQTTYTYPNYIKVKFGEGHFYLNCTPLAFTNFYILGGNQNYVANSLSYLKNRKTLYWDEYKKSGRLIINSPLRFILNQAALKWAYYLALLGVLLFYIYKTKRQQRIIPVIEPLQNTSVAFAQTVGGLYYQHKDYTNLITKKLNYFLEHIRSQYYINTATINDRTAKDLAAKSGKPLAETKALIDLINHLKNKSHHSENDIIELNKKITAFKK